MSFFSSSYADMSNAEKDALLKPLEKAIKKRDWDEVEKEFKKVKDYRFTE